MAQTKQFGVAYAAAAALDGTETLSIVQGGTTVDTTTQDIADLADTPPDPVTALSIVAGVVTINCALGKSFTCTLTANVTSIVLTNLAGAGLATEVDIEWKQDGTGGRTVAQPAAFKALGGSDTAVATAANAVTVQTAKTWDNGTTWRYAMQESA